MFGSQFGANFGLVGFPFDSLDPQGGLFGQNAPAAGSEVGTIPNVGTTPVQGTQGVAPSGHAPAPTDHDQAPFNMGKDSKGPALTSSLNPLSLGPLGADQLAPAAGIKSEFEGL